VSATEVLDAVLARAQAVQQQLNCFLRIDEALARAAARLADADLARGHLRGPLHGVPLAHKDLF
jgi:Asp-tRNA(Asn)/Glu-tRNA(Gln) amidotransferase A subunit family amidase